MCARRRSLRRSRATSAIVPGDVNKSALIARIFTDDKDEIMPPPKSHKKLTAAQKETLKRWVAEGAKYEKHWAFVPRAAGEGAGGDGFSESGCGAAEVAAQ